MAPDPEYARRHRPDQPPAGRSTAVHDPFPAVSEVTVHRSVLPMVKATEPNGLTPTRKPETVAE